MRIGHESIAGYLEGGLGDLGRRRPAGRVERPPDASPSWPPPWIGADPIAPLVIDVRQASEYEAGHVDGAWHIGAGELPGRLAELPRDRPIATICAAGYRASVAASLLDAAGFTNVSSVAGGIDDLARPGPAPRARPPARSPARTPQRSRTATVVAEPDPARRDQDRAPDPERQGLGRRHVGPGRGQQLERVEAAPAGVRIVGRDRAAADVAVQLNDHLAQPDPAAEPGVLGVGLDPVDHGRHPEAARIERLVEAGGTRPGPAASRAR